MSDLRVFISRFVDLGVGSGITISVARYNKNQERDELEHLLRTAISGIAITGLLVVLACVILAPWFSRLLLGNETFGSLIIMVGLTVAFTGQGTVIYRCLQGMLKIREMVVLGIISSILGLIITIPFIYFFNVTGAVLSITLGAALSLLIGQLYLNWAVLKELNIRLRFIVPDMGIWMQLLRFGTAASINVLSDALTLLIIRSIIIKQIGADSNGIYQVALALSNRYIGLILSAILQYGLPKLSSVRGNHKATAKVQNDSVRLLFLVLVPLVVVILVFRNFWIPLLYSAAFLSAYSLLSWQMLGDIFRAIINPINSSLLPNEKFGFFIFFTLSYSAVQLISFWLLFPSMGLMAAPISYAAGRGLLLPIVIFWHYRNDKFIYSLQNWSLIARSSLVLGLTMFLTASPTAGLITGYVIPLAALAGWAGTSVTPVEAKKAFEVGQRFMARWRFSQRS